MQMQQLNGVTLVRNVLIGACFAAGLIGCRERKQETQIQPEESAIKKQLEPLVPLIKTNVADIQQLLEGVKADGTAWIDLHKDQIMTIKKNLAASEKKMDSIILKDSFTSMPWKMQLGSTHSFLENLDSALSLSEEKRYWTNSTWMQQGGESGMNVARDAITALKSVLVALGEERRKVNSNASDAYYIFTGTGVGQPTMIFGSSNSGGESQGVNGSSPDSGGSVSEGASSEGVTSEGASGGVSGGEGVSGGGSGSEGVSAGEE